MPYTWSEKQDTKELMLTLWPHQSLPPKGFAAFILATSTLIMIPLFPLLGTVLLWGLLPFLVVAVGGVWFAIRKNQRDARILEIMRATPEEISLTRRSAKGPDQNWVCNAYWASPHLHKHGGPVPNYVTLRGGGREVEIGSFLSEEERKSLYDDLTSRLGQLRGATQ